MNHAIKRLTESGFGKVFLLLFLFGTFVFLSLNKLRNEPQKVIWADAEGYYMYLPGTFIYGFRDMPTRTPGWPMIDQRTFTKFTCGVALMQMPFWLPVHLLTNTDGFSYSDGLAVICATIFYFLLGCFLLFRVLSQSRRSVVVWASLVLLTVGTNLYFYVISESGMSHVYSFFIFAVIVFLTDKYWQDPSLGMTAALGVAFFLAVLIRPTNIIMVLWIFGYDASHWRIMGARLRDLLRDPYRLVTLLLVGLAVVAPQVCYWKFVTNEWLSYSYGEEGFPFWSSPKMIQVLTHRENGLLLYSPILLFALAGIYSMYRHRRANAVLLISIFLLATYIFGSWWDWNFGGAFGHRCYVEFYALLSIPFCYCVEQLVRSKNRRIQVFATALLVVMVIYSLRMTYSYASPWDGPDWTWEVYLDRVLRAFWIR